MKLKIDLHVHTNHSQCALIRPEEIEKTALKRGLHAVAVTDHNTIDGAREVLSFAKTIKIIAQRTLQTKIGIFIKVIPGQRIFKMVTKKLIPESVVPTPAICKIQIQ